MTNDREPELGRSNHEGLLSQWSEPIKFEDFALPDFNIDIFPSWLRDFVEAVSESTQTPVDMASMAAFSILSVVSAKKVEINPYGDWREPLNTYIMTLMGPANRKSSVFREMTNPIISYERVERERLSLEVKQRESERRRLTKRLEHLEGIFARKDDGDIKHQILTVQKELHAIPNLSLPTFITDDVTPESLTSLMYQNQNRIGVLSAEGGIFDMIKGRYSGQINLEVYLKGHSGDHIRVDRRNRTEILESPALTIGVFGQKEVIKEIPRPLQGRGLMARFLYSIPKDQMGYRNTRPTSIPNDVREKYYEEVNKLIIDKPSETIELTLTKEADAIFKNFQDRCEQKLRNGEDLFDMPEWGGKFAGHIARVCGLLHIADNGTSSSSTEISQETVIKAISLEEYFITHAQAAFGFMRKNPMIEDAKYLLDVIERHAHKCTKVSDATQICIPYRTIQQNVKNRIDSKQLSSLLSELEERGFIRISYENSNHSKPKKFLIVNPSILKN